MGLVLNFNTENTDSPKEFKFFDTTGIYPNPITGYGSPNPTTGQVTQATLTVLPYLSTATPSVVNVFSSGIPFPNTSNIPTIILNTDIGLSADQNIPSGIYGMTYYVNAGIHGEFTTVKYVYIDALHLCCLSKALAKVSDCNCSSDSAERAIKIAAMIDAIHQALLPSCNEIERAYNLSKQLDTICEGCGCGCS